MAKGFSKKVLKRFEILKEAYENEGSMTIRRCFYILVGKNEIKNSKSSYQGLSQHLKIAREKGLVDWEIITDRHRTILKRNTYSSFDEIFDIACKNFRKNSMDLQKNYVEVWIEKDAVSGIIYDFTHDLDIPLFVGKGFSSITYLKKASDRFKGQDKPCIILYISDFDPEGEFFPKKVRQKLIQYGCKDFIVDKISLTKEQIKNERLPSNKDFKIKAKHKEKKYVQDFIEQNGEIQVELDALSNKILVEILRTKIEKENLLDLNLPEESDKKSLKEVEDWIERNLR